MIPCCFPQVGKSSRALIVAFSAKPLGFTPIVESDLSSIAAEYRPISACLTQNKAKGAIR